MKQSTKDNYARVFKKLISDKAREIDPNNELDWYSLTVGWVMGHGFSIKDAHEFALFIRYHTELG